MRVTEAFYQITLIKNEITMVSYYTTEASCDLVAAFYQIRFEKYAMGMPFHRIRLKKYGMGMALH